MLYKLISIYSYILGLYFLGNKKYYLAIEKFTVSIEKTTSKFLRFSSYKYIGIANYYLENFSGAHASLSEAFRILPIGRTDSELYSFLGYISHGMNNIKDAKEFYRKAINCYKNSDKYTDINYVKELFTNLNK